MPTAQVALDTTQYVQINTGFNPMMIQAHRDAVRIVLSAAKPAVSNTVFHLLESKHPPLQLLSLDTNVWALATSDRCSLFVSETDPIKMALNDGSNNPLSSYYDTDTGEYILNIHNADVHSYPVNQFMHYHTAVASTVATAADALDYDLIIADATGFNAGDTVQINGETSLAIFAEIISIATNTLTLDRPLDRAVAIGESVTVVESNMVYDGSTTVRVYSITPPAGFVFHITRIIFYLTHGSAGDLGLFGNIAALTRGVVVRGKVGGQYGTFTNWKTNADMKKDMFDVEFNTRSGGGGTHGTSGRGSFNKIGVAVRLDGDAGDELQVVIQDNLTVGGDLVSFEMNAQGHIEGG